MNADWRNPRLSKGYLCWFHGTCLDNSILWREVACCYSNPTCLLFYVSLAHMLTWPIHSHTCLWKKLEFFFLLNVLNSFRWSCKLNSLLKVSFFFVAWEERSLSNQVVYLKLFFFAVGKNDGSVNGKKYFSWWVFCVNFYLLRYF